MRLEHVLPRLAVAASLTLGAVAGVTMTATAAEATVCTATWIGPANGSWSVASNWSPAAVPNLTSQVCVDTSAGPSIDSGTAAQAARLIMTGSSLQLDGTLAVPGFKIARSDLSGAGTLSGASTQPKTLSGVIVTGGLTLSVDSVTVTGARFMCGGRLSLCLNGASSLTAQHGVRLAGGSIGGNTTAVPAVNGSLAGVLLQGPAASDRITVDLLAGQITETQPSDTTLRLDRWEQLSADGTLSASIHLTRARLVLARSIVTLADYVGVPYGHLQTPDGADAFSALTTITPHTIDSPLALPSVVQPQGGTLSLTGPSNAHGFSMHFVATSTPVTITGTLANAGDLAVDGDVRPTAFLSTGVSAVDDGGSITTMSAKVHTGTFQFIGHGTLASTNGTTFDGSATLAGFSAATDPASSCGTFDGNVTMTAHSRMRLLLAAPEPGCPATFTSTGVFSLPTTLAIRTGQEPTAGTQIVLVDAAGGVQGTFSTITQTGPAPHWVISYTGTQVIATYSP